MKNLAQIFKALSDETRLDVIALLSWTEKLCVCDIENILELTQSKASRHLRYLSNKGLISAEKANQWIYYSIIWDSSPKTQKILKLMKTVFNGDEYLELKEKLQKRLEDKKIEDKCKIKEGKDGKN